MRRADVERLGKLSHRKPPAGIARQHLLDLLPERRGAAGAGRTRRRVQDRAAPRKQLLLKNGAPLSSAAICRTTGISSGSDSVQGRSNTARSAASGTKLMPSCVYAAALDSVCASPSG